MNPARKEPDHLQIQQRTTQQASDTKHATDDDR